MSQILSRWNCSASSGKHRLLKTLNTSGMFLPSLRSFYRDKLVANLNLRASSLDMRQLAFCAVPLHWQSSFHYASSCHMLYSAWISAHSLSALPRSICSLLVFISSRSDYSPLFILPPIAPVGLCFHISDSFLILGNGFLWIIRSLIITMSSNTRIAASLINIRYTLWLTWNHGMYIIIIFRHKHFSTR